MNRNDYERIMDEAVAGRLKSPSWDLRIAAAVFAGRRTRARRLMLSSAASLAFAASVIIALASGFLTQPEQVYEPFIARQLAGTHETVFPSSDTAADEGVQRVEIVFDSGVDSVIDNALALR